jgi:hypothetical protein
MKMLLSLSNRWVNQDIANYYHNQFRTGRVVYWCLSSGPHFEALAFIDYLNDYTGGEV